MNLNEYYRNNKDEINSSIMEIASDLAVGRMAEKHQQLFETFVESDPDDDNCTHYKEEYQDEYNQFYDEEYARVARVMKFDFYKDDGVAVDADNISDKIDNLFTQYVEENGEEPRYANCTIRFLDDKETQEMIIKLSLDVIESEDDTIFYYCDSLSDFKSLTTPGVANDFVITECLSLS